MMLVCTTGGNVVDVSPSVVETTTECVSLIAVVAASEGVDGVATVLVCEEATTVVAPG